MRLIFVLFFCCISFFARADLIFNVSEIVCSSDVIRIPVKVDESSSHHYLIKITGTDERGKQFQLPVESVEKNTHMIEFSNKSLESPFVKIRIEALGVTIETQCKQKNEKNTS